MSRPGDSVSIHIRDLAVHCHHGVTDAEREVGQRLLIDVRIEPASCGALETDSLADTVDYSEACDLVVRAASRDSHGTLERVADALADEVLESLAVKSVHVWIRKLAPPIGHAVGEVGIELDRRA